MNNRKNNEEIKEYFDSIEVPEEVSPENIRKMLDEKAAANKETEKRQSVSMWKRTAAAAAACAVVAGVGAGSMHFLRTKDGANDKVIADTTDPTGQPNGSGSGSDSGSDSGSGNSAGNGNDDETVVVEAPYMKGAKSYRQIYNIMGASNKLYEEEMEKYGGYEFVYDASEEDGFAADGAIPETAVNGAETDKEYDDGFSYPTDSESGSGDESDDYSKTYDQEQGVLEADIAKTDGKRIYYLSEYADYAELKVASVDNGKFTNYNVINIGDDIVTESGDTGYSINVEDMYLYNGMIAVIGDVYSYTKYYEDDEEYYCYDCWYNSNGTETFVAFYSCEDEPQLLNVYRQDGSYTDVRIIPDGYMYVVSSYSSYIYTSIDDCDDVEKYIPQCGMDTCELIPPEDILLPHDPLDSSRNLSYTVIGSIDLTTEGQASVSETKALAGYTGNIYCTAENMYTTVGYDNTDITRISVAGGQITPAASGTVSGRVKDQFSLSEYNGYLRVAATYSGYEEHKTLFGINDRSEWKQENNIYVLDMDLNTVGSLTGLAEGESIKSVSFQGDMGYVVTYRQTDPLFAIDLSDPTTPVVTDEYKILGYSTYMQQWDEEHLLGFGKSADENGIENGIKLVMFNNSDPYDLKEEGIYYMLNQNYEDGWYDTYVESIAVYERKALLIAPEKNLIGVPVTEYNWAYADGEDKITNSFRFFSYEDGSFTYKGEVSCSNNNYDYYSNVDARAMYIGDYVYTVSNGNFAAADIETITETDRILF